LWNGVDGPNELYVRFDSQYRIVVRASGRCKLIVETNNAASMAESGPK
jgi:hypothetical protein